MTFKLYDKKSSTDNKNCRLVQGGTIEQNGIFLSWWEKAEIEKDDTTDIKFVITKDTEFRADKISYRVYGRDDYDWLVLQYNNIIDIIEELSAGTVIVLPSYQRAIFSLMNN